VISYGYAFTKHAVFLSLTFAALGAASRLAPYRIESNSLSTWVICFVVIDFLYYWDHRLGHEINWIWSFHSIHHSSEEFNLAVASRLPWFEEVYRWIFLVPAALLGFPVPMILASKVLNRTYQFFVHTRYIGNLGPLEWVLATPSQHRVHHGRNPEYLDKNYGGFLCLWDRLFGTFEEELAKVEYGLVEQIGTLNPFKVQIAGLAKLGHQLAGIAGWRGKVRLLFAHPSAAQSQVNWRSAMNSRYPNVPKSGSLIHSEIDHFVAPRDNRFGPCYSARLDRFGRHD